MKVYTLGKNIIKSWCDNPEEGAIDQAVNLSNLPFVNTPVCLMPDTHCGYGMPIGGVIACEGVVIPNAVGVDIGCGMLAVQTNLRSISTDRLKEIMTLIRKRVPVGFNHHTKKKSEKLMPDKGQLQLKICNEEYESARKQLGTLGGGNHFIEIQKGSDGYIWFMIHSGSRNLGYKVANYYNKLAKDLNSKWFTSVPKEWDLAFLPNFSEEAGFYNCEMIYCLEFALKNRQVMAEAIKQSFLDKPCPECQGKGGVKNTKCEACNGKGSSEIAYDVKFLEEINIHHNYASWEHYKGKNYIIHRKGATSARAGELGIIPGSQGTKSYIVVGKGSEESYNSCSHGAGRKMSRNKARENLNLEEELDKLSNVLHALRHKKNLDEAPGAYKDIDVVMEEQKDLIEIKVELTPLAVLKG